MKLVPLHGRKADGRSALVDDADYELVMRHRWHAVEFPRGPNRRPAGPYAQTNIRRPDGRWTTVQMHKLITGYRRVDHADHDGLNNQRHNLRDATAPQNSQNSKGRLLRRSRYKGVSYRGWHARIMIDGKNRHLGYFGTEEEAARAYDAAARAAWGEFAYLNFPAAGP